MRFKLFAILGVLLSYSPHLNASENVVNVTLGSDGAIVKLTEYLSLSCDGCAEFHQAIFPGLKQYYIDKGVMQYTIRPFPTTKRSLAGALLVSCVEETSRKLQLIDELLTRQAEWAPESLTTENVQPLMLDGNEAEIARLKKLQEKANDTLKTIAADYGIDDVLFEVCMGNREAQEQIREAVSHAINDREVTTVPSFFVNGEPVPFNPSIGNDIVERVKALRDGDAEQE